MFRRTFLKASGALLLAAPLSCSRPSGATAERSPGLQLFTVMVELEKDFEGTLNAVAEIGYREVETTGAFGRDPRYVRDMLDKYGLTTPSQHLVPGNLYDVFNAFTQRRMSMAEVQKRWLAIMSVERVEPIITEAISRARVLGQKYLVWQILWPEQMATRQQLDQFCRAMDVAGKLCADAGLVFNFHNHADELQSRFGIVPYDVLIESTDPDRVKLEIDTYWITKGGGDPVRYLQRYPDRFVQCHLKDSTPGGDFTTVGQGVVDFPALLAAARRAGIKHYYVEYDRSDDPMTAVRQSWAYLVDLM